MHFSASIFTSRRILQLQHRFGHLSDGRIRKEPGQEEQEDNLAKCRLFQGGHATNVATSAIMLRFARRQNGYVTTANNQATSQTVVHFLAPLRVC